MKRKEHVTVIILNWNGKHFLKANLSSVLKQDYPNYEILIVDNGSSDGSIEFIQKKCKRYTRKLKLLKTGENLGYVGGNNAGIKKVLKENRSKYVVILNNDIKVEETWLSNLISGFTNPQIGICTSKILLYYPFQHIVLIPSKESLLSSIKINGLDYHALEFKDGIDKKGELLKLPKQLFPGQIYNLALPYKPNHARSGRLGIKYSGNGMKLFSGSLRKELKGSGEFKVNLEGEYVLNNAGSDFYEKKILFEDRYIFEFDRELPSDVVAAGCGAAMAIRCDLLKSFGAFNERYFMYLEDTELSYRFKQQGFLTKFVGNAVCYHWFWGSSGGKVTKTQTFYGTRNRLWFIKRYFGLGQFLYFYLRTLLRTFIWGIKIPFNKRAPMYFSCYVKALFEALNCDNK
ncbi:glycosyltransferase family 2 protein [Candidatus Dojkabacteria bacterium]|nr:glycosyltransferase family 2 protein [Candidatus Dojkabacteria bacterium]